MSIMVKFSSTTQQRRLPEHADRKNVNATLNITKKKPGLGYTPAQMVYMTHP